MTGMPKPQSVEVTIDEQVLKGCGGDPASLVRGPAWVVEDIDKSGVIERSRPTLLFDDKGRLSGSASCNTYTASYAIGGEGLAIGKSVSTRKACPPALMTQEQVFLAFLEAVDRFEIGEDGALILHAATRTLRARR